MQHGSATSELVLPGLEALEPVTQPVPATGSSAGRRSG